MAEITQYNHSPRQLALIQNTVAKDCNTDEFNLFIEVARAKGLDPFLGQIIPMVFSKNNADKRKMTIIISRDGQRVIAQRCGDYRPASKPPVYECDESLKSPTNPHGIMSATVYLWKQDQKTADWYEVAGQAFWDEFAPLKDEWADDEASGKRKPTGRKTLDATGKWATMPRLMISKCFDDQTEVLTASGFRKFSEVDAPIMQVTESGLNPVAAMPFSQPYSGHMIVLDSDDLNFSVTPNHDMVTTQGKMEALELFREARSRPRHFIPRIVPSAAVDAEFSDRAIILAAAYLTDGSDQSTSSFRISVSRPRKISLLNDIGGYRTQSPLRRAGVIATVETRTIETRSDQTTFRYGFDAIDGLARPGKRTDMSALIMLSKRQARLFADHMLFFDGSTSTNGVKRFYSSNPAIMDAFEVAAIIGGYAVSNRKRRTSDIGTNINEYITVSDRDAICVRRWGRNHSLSKDNASNRTGLTTHPNQSGLVWCVTVPSGKIVVRRNGFSMICGNCAEMQALRAGWPEQFTGLYDEAEMDKARSIDLAASEIVAHEQEEMRLKQIAGNDSITMAWGDGFALENVPISSFMDRCLEFIAQSSRETVAKWHSANRAGLQLFWARHPGDAHELKKAIERASKPPATIDGISHREIINNPIVQPLLAG